MLMSQVAQVGLEPLGSPRLFWPRTDLCKSPKHSLGSGMFPPVWLSLVAEVKLS